MQKKKTQKQIGGSTKNLGYTFRILFHFKTMYFEQPAFITGKETSFNLNHFLVGNLNNGLMQADLNRYLYCSKILI